MPVDTQTRDIGSSTANGLVDLQSLTSEIQANNDIVTGMLNGAFVEVDGTDVIVKFKDTLSPAELTAFDDTLLAHQGVETVFTVPIQQVSIEGLHIQNGKMDTAVFPPPLSRKNFFSHDFTDPTTWTWKSVRVEDHVMVRKSERIYELNPDNLPEGVTIEGLHIIDVGRAKIFDEDFLTDDLGRTYHPIVKVNGEVKTEQTLNDPVGYDYTLDYCNEPAHGQSRAKVSGRVEFDKELDESDVVEITFYRATTSEFALIPAPGKKIELKKVEIQFSTNVSIRDTMEFQPYIAYKGMTPEQQQQTSLYLQSIGQLPPGVDPPPDTVFEAGRPTRYKSMKDFLNEANGNYPVIPASQAPKAETENNPRDLSYDVTTYKWEYEAFITLESSKGMYVVVRLRNDIPYYGEFGTATFYGYSEDEVPTS